MPPKYRKYQKKALKKERKAKTGSDTKLTVKDVKRIAKSVIMSKAETKQHLIAFNRAPLYHNGGASGVTGAQMNLTNNMPSVGTAENERIGAEIYAKGFRVTMMITLPFDRLNTSLRIMVLSVSKGYNPLSSYDAIYDAISNNVMTDPIDQDRVKILSQYFINAKKEVAFNPNVPTGTNKELTIFRKIWVPFNKKLKFLESNSNVTSYGRDVIVVCHAFDAWGSLSADIVSYIKVDSKLYFKDI